MKRKTKRVRNQAQATAHLTIRKALHDFSSIALTKNSIKQTRAGNILITEPGVFVHHTRSILRYDKVMMQGRVQSTTKPVYAAAVSAGRHACTANRQRRRQR